jgi:hypothetical protein
MKAAYRIEHVPQITVVDDGMIMMLWNQKLRHLRDREAPAIERVAGR